MSSMIGQAIGKYTVLAEIGRGGMAVVYRARDTVLDRDVALKLMAPHLAWDPQFVERFMAEARAVARLKHPNIVVIYDVGKYQERPFLAMEYIAGHSLAAVVQKGRALPPPYVAGIVAQVADALDHAHSQNIVHRDIKPGNIIVGANNHVTLTDFGVARALESTHMTQTGTLLGTPAYMSPEQVLGKEAIPASDQYSLGIVAYEMLAGVAPFQGDTSVVILHNQVYTPPPPLRHFNPSLNPEFEAVINKALAKDPKARYAMTRQFAARLSATAGTASVIVPPLAGDSIRNAGTVLKSSSGGGRGQPPGPFTPPPVGQPTGPRRAHWPWLALALALVVAVLALGGVFLAGRTSGQQQTAAPVFAPTAGPADRGAVPVVMVLASSTPASPSPAPTQRPTDAPSASPTPRPEPTQTATAAPTLAPTASPEPPTPEPAPVACTKDLQLVAHVQPGDSAAVTPGQVFTKVWSIKNIGTCTWVEDYQVAYESGNQMGAAAVIAFNYRMTPDQTATVSVDWLRAPTTPGTYVGVWRLRDASGTAFGEPLLVRIVVTEAPAPRPVASAAPPPVAARPPVEAPTAAPLPPPDVPPPTVPPPTTPPRPVEILQFWADDDTVEPASPDSRKRCTLLLWRVEGVASMRVIDARSGQLVKNGTIGSTYPGEVRESEVCPTQNTTYILKVTPVGGTEYDWGSVTIKIN